VKIIFDQRKLFADTDLKNTDYNVHGSRSAHSSSKISGLRGKELKGL